MSEERKLMNPAELAKASHMRPGDPRIAMLAEVSGLKRVDRCYNEIKAAPGEEFITALFGWPLWRTIRTGPSTGWPCCMCSANGVRT